MKYPTQNEYGVIGNQFSTALVSESGSIDWCCFPYLDSASHFAAFIDNHQGGRFQIIPHGEFRTRQRYVPKTMVLETLFETPQGRAKLTDWMPAGAKSPTGPTLCRQIETLEGQIQWNLTCTPRFKYGTEQAQSEKHPNGVLFRGRHPDDLAILSSEVPLELLSSATAAGATFILAAGEKARFTWAWGRYKTFSDLAFPLSTSFPDPQTTVEYWEKASHKCPPSGCIFGGPWHDAVDRSNRLLRLLALPYSGAIAEAVVVSLMGPTSRTRTWGHRYASIREGASTLQALTHLGRAEEARAYFSWLKEIVERDGAEGLQSVYTLDGGKAVHESSRQFQLDIYGHVMLATSEYFKIFGEMAPSLWSALTEIADYVCQAWRRPDYGPAENTAKPEHFVVSKLFCWAALDQACWLADAVGKPPSPRWKGERAILHRTICSQGFDPLQNSFIRSFGDTEIDPLVLWIFILNFLPVDDPRVQGTLARVRGQLSEGVLLKEADTPNFSITFLLISCLALSNQAAEATDRLAETCTYASRLGFFANQASSENGVPAIHFPSASAHLSLINAALYVGWARGRKAA